MSKLQECNDYDDLIQFRSDYGKSAIDMPEVRKQYANLRRKYKEAN